MRRTLVSALVLMAGVAVDVAALDQDGERETEGPSQGCLRVRLVSSRLAMALAGRSLGARQARSAAE